MDAVLLALQSVETARQRSQGQVSAQCHCTFEAAAAYTTADHARGVGPTKLTSDHIAFGGNGAILFVLHDEKEAAGLPSSQSGQIPQCVLSQLQLVAEQPGLTILQTCHISHGDQCSVLLWYCGLWWCFAPNEIASDWGQKLQPAADLCRTKQSAAKNLSISSQALLTRGVAGTAASGSSPPHVGVSAAAGCSPADRPAHAGINCQEKAENLASTSEDDSSDSDDEIVVHVPSLAPPRTSLPALPFEEYRLSPQCIICLEAFPATQPHVRAVFDACNHAYCHVACAAPWVASSSSCPLCKATVAQLLDVTVTPTPRLSSLGSLATPPDADTFADMDTTVHRSCVTLNRRHAVAAATLQVEAGEELTAALQAQLDNALCMVCGHDQDDHLLLLCDGCEGGAHTYCVGLSAVPSGDWFCGSCQSARPRENPTPRPAQPVMQHAAPVQLHSGASVPAAAPRQSVRARLQHMLLQRRRQHSRQQLSQAAMAVESGWRDVAPDFSDASFSDSDEDRGGHVVEDKGGAAARGNAAATAASNAAPACALFAWADEVQLEKPAVPSAAPSTTPGGAGAVKRRRGKATNKMPGRNDPFQIPKKKR